MNAKQKKIVAWSIIALIALFVIIVIAKARKKAKLKAAQEAETDPAINLNVNIENPAPAAPVNTTTYVSQPAASFKTYSEADQSGFPVKLGDYSNRVGVIQKYLNKYYNAGLTVDNNFGNATLTALRNNLKTDSVYWNDYYKMLMLTII